MADERQFPDRLMKIIGGRYDPLMRRSVQSAILFQANSDVEESFPALKIFQRKILFFQAATKIANSLEDIPIEHREKLMVRTCTAAVPLTPDLAWRRFMFTKREGEKTVKLIRPFLSPDKTHDQVCDEYVQDQYNKRYDDVISNQKGLRRPVIWEFSHLKEFIVYRLFYNGEDIQVLTSVASHFKNRDARAAICEALPSSRPMTTVIPPAARAMSLPPDDGYQGEEKKTLETKKTTTIMTTTAAPTTPAAPTTTAAPTTIMTTTAALTTPAAPTTAISTTTPKYIKPVENKTVRLSTPTVMDTAKTTSIVAPKDERNQAEERRLLLEEIKEHLNILKEFEGIIPKEELNLKKRELFLSLPSLPNTAGHRLTTTMTTMTTATPQPSRNSTFRDRNKRALSLDTDGTVASTQGSDTSDEFLSNDRKKLKSEQSTIFGVSEGVGAETAVSP